RSACRQPTTRRSRRRNSASFGCDAGIDHANTKNAKTHEEHILCFVCNAMTYSHLTSQRDGAVERLTLNRPDVRNAFNEHVIAELTAWAEATRDAGRRGEVRAVVMSGAGKMFCAGADVNWMSRTIRYSKEENLRDAMAM